MASGTINKIPDRDSLYLGDGTKFLTVSLSASYQVTLDFGSSGKAGFLVTSGITAAAAGMWVYGKSAAAITLHQVLALSGSTFTATASGNTVVIANNTGYRANVFVCEFRAELPSVTVEAIS